MKTKNLLLFSMISLYFFSQTIFAQSPDWLWAKAIVRTGNLCVHAYGMTTDASGNVYTIGNKALKARSINYHRPHQHLISSNNP